MELLVEAAKQIPALAVLVFLVVHFLKSTRDRDATRAKEIENLQARYEKTTEALVHENHEVLERNRILYERVIALLGKLEVGK